MPIFGKVNYEDHKTNTTDMGGGDTFKDERLIPFEKFV
jgi:hypothetical protein